MILSNTINQRYRYATQGKTPTQIQHELRELGVKGFVVKVAGSRVTMKVSECDIKKEQGVFEMIPKFRAWNKVREEMIDDCDLAITSDGSILAGDLNYDEESGMLVDVTDNVVIMMPTRLKDKNGTEIYEGDIVKYNIVPNPFLSDNYFKIIQARSGEWRIDNYIEGRVLIFNNHQVEVVGNIFENKELLEDKVNGH